MCGCWSSTDRPRALSLEFVDLLHVFHPNILASPVSDSAVQFQGVEAFFNRHYGDSFAGADNLDSSQFVSAAGYLSLAGEEA